MKRRTFWSTSPRRAGAAIVDEPGRWEELVRAARGWLTSDTPESHVKYCLSRARLARVLGPPSQINPCTRLCEEVARRLFPPSRGAVFRPGVDREAMLADNRDLILSLCDQVENRCASARAVAAAGRRLT